MGYVDYEVNAEGVIVTPGKFEGQKAYLPVAYGTYLAGFADDDDGDVVTVTLDDGKVVKFIETEQGFVEEV